MTTKEQRKAQQFQQKQLKREYKLYIGEMKATNDQQGIIEGYLNAIGNIDYGKDRTLAGAFKRTLNNAYERKKAESDDYLWPYLWNHDYDLIPPGGIFDAEEDKKGLYIKSQLNLDYQLARDMYSSYKARTLKKQSMGYICHQSEYVKAEVDGVMTTVRDLIEVEVLEGSGVVFPMNDLADVTGVKNGLYVPKFWQGWSMETKMICGNTSGTIGPRDEAWDSSKAEKQIWAAAYDDETSKINTTLAKKYFMVQDGDAQKKGSYSYPFWYVGDSPHICVGAVIAIAGAIGGARNADAPDGLKPKVETLYNRINKKYPDDNQLTPPWNDDGKRSRRMPATTEKKDFNDLYQAAQAADCLEDWGDIINTLTQTMLQIFGMGDSPAPDMSDALSQFGEAVTAWQEKAVECGLSDYISDQGYCNNYSGVPYVPYSLQVGYMSRNTPNVRAKSGASFSQANTDAIHGHVKSLHDMADEQCKSMHDAADGLLDALSGLGAPTDPSYRQQGTTEDDEKAFRRFLAHTRRKSGAEFSQDNLQMLGSHIGGLHDVADTLHQMAEDLAENTGATTYVDPDGDADTAKETDKNKAASLTAARRKTAQHSPDTGTADDWSSVLSGLQSLKPS